MSTICPALMYVAGAYGTNGRLISGQTVFAIRGRVRIQTVRLLPYKERCDNPAIFRPINRPIYQCSRVMSAIDPGIRLIRAPKLVASDMDGDTVMMNIERGQYFGIGGVGTRIWALLEAPVSLAQIVQVIHAEYEVDIVTCERDVFGFAQKLLDNGVVIAC